MAERESENAAERAAEREDEQAVVVPLPGENEPERRRIRRSNERDQADERQGKPSRHNRGYDEAADGADREAKPERVVDED